MKGVEMLCASQASTAGSSSTIQLGGRAIDRYNPIIRDERRCSRALPGSSSSSSSFSSSHSPAHPKPRESRKSSSKSKDKRKKTEQKKMSSSEAVDIIKKSIFKPSDIISKTCVNPGRFLTPPGSSRYLLSDAACLEGSTDYNPAIAVSSVSSIKNGGFNLPEIVLQPKDNQEINQHRQLSSLNSVFSSRSDQVVVLRVSLHCKGCEGKLRKHLSRMEGVTSFNIDFAAKKVTVVGDVRPSDVLASVSKVKNAQFWAAAGPTTKPIAI